METVVQPGSSSQEEEGLVTKVNVGRLTNCIFAFTLLYLFKNINLPNIFDNNPIDSVVNYSVVTFPEICNFINVYLTVAIIWILTFHTIHLIRKVNTHYLYLHFGMLMTLVFIPVSSFLADGFPSVPLFSLVLHINILILSFLLLLQWHYVSGTGNLIFNDISRGEIKNTQRRILILMIIACIGALLAWGDMEKTRFLYLAALGLLCFDSVIPDWEEWKKKKGCEGSDVTDNIQGSGAHFNHRLSPVSQGTEENSFRGHVGLDMLEILMNGVFAFSMTLIVKNIPLPKITDVQSLDLIFMFLTRIMFDSIEFVLAFIILALFWILSFQIIRWMRMTDLSFVYLVLSELLFIVFIPVTSSLFTLYSDQAHSSVLFSLNIILCGLILIMQWYYLSRRGELLIKEIDLCHSDTGSAIKSWIQFAKGTGTQNPIINLKNRLFILPVTCVLWLFMNLLNIGFSILPALLGVCLLIVRTGD